MLSCLGQKCFLLPAYPGQDAKTVGDRLPHGPNIFSPHLQVFPAFIHDVIHDYFTDLRLTLAEVASKDPKGFIER